jgi:hypothetical protein
MLKWLVLPVVVFAYLVATVSAAAPRDRDHDRLPDRWERKHDLSTKQPSAKRDPDGDRLSNRRELRRRTNPRKRDSDGDGFSDRCELRKHTSPRKRRSRPKSRCSKSPKALTPPGSPKPTAGWPDASNTGVPPGTTLRPSSGITVKRDGTVIDGVDAPWIEVQAANVTIRNSRVGSTSFSAIYNRSGAPGLVVEDTTLDNTDGTCISATNFTARRVEMTRCENGASADNNVTIEDSWIHDLDTSGDAHTDGIQSGAGASNVTIRHNNIDPVPSGQGCTSPIIMHTGGGTQNSNWTIEDNRLDGAGCSVALYCPRANASNIFIRNNRMLKGVFGSYTDSCSRGHYTEFSGNVDGVTGAPLRR